MVQDRAFKSDSYCCVDCCLFQMHLTIKGKRAQRPWLIVASFKSSSAHQLKIAGLGRCGAGLAGSFSGLLDPSPTSHPPLPPPSPSVTSSSLLPWCPQLPSSQQNLLERLQLRDSPVPGRDFALAALLFRLFQLKVGHQSWPPTPGLHQLSLKSEYPLFQSQGNIFAAQHLWWGEVRVSPLGTHPLSDSRVGVCVLFINIWNFNF